MLFFKFSPIFISSIRHEVAHVVDVHDILDNHSQVFECLAMFAKITDDLINQVHCVFKKGYINEKVLANLHEIINEASHNFVISKCRDEDISVIVKI